MKRFVREYAIWKSDRVLKSERYAYLTTKRKAEICGRIEDILAYYVKGVITEDEAMREISCAERRV